MMRVFEKKCFRVGIWLCLLLVYFAGMGDAKGLVISWSSLNWTAGALTQDLEFDSSNPGADATITVSGDTDKLVSGFPVDDSNLTGGYGTSAQSLRLRADFNQADRQLLTVTVTFHYNNLATGPAPLYDSVKDLNFQIFDIDTDGSYVDQIRDISAHYAGGATFGATTLTGGSDVVISGSGTNATATGTTGEAGDSPNGNLTVDFGTNALTEFTFTYANDTSALNNPNVQNVGLFNINFNRHNVPEVGPAAAVIVVCGLAMLGRLRRRSAR